MSVGTYVKVISGANAGMYGYVVEVFSRDVRIRLTNGTTVTVNRHRLEVQE